MKHFVEPTKEHLDSQIYDIDDGIRVVFSKEEPPGDVDTLDHSASEVCEDSPEDPR